jgi:hypothetical protein
MIIDYKQAKLLGYPENDFFIQTILFDKRIPKARCIEWLKQHHYIYNDYRITGKHRRFMQTHPVKGAQYITKKISGDIDLIFQKFYI